MGNIRPTYGRFIPKPIKGGYLRIWKPKHPVSMRDGLALVHRIVWYDKHGTIPKGYHIHHIDGDPTNNNINNLELISNSNHQLKHRETGSYIKNQYGTYRVKPIEDRISTRKKNKLLFRNCIFCGNSFNNKRRDAKYCSSNCRVSFCKSRKIGF